MIVRANASKKKIEHAVESFWETFPQFWRRVRGHIREVSVLKYDISVEQFHILRHLRKAQGSVSSLAEAQNISRPAISQAIDTLVKKGLVTRMPDSHDRRHVYLDLTPEGIFLLDAVFNDTRQWMAQVFANLNNDELQRFTEAMESFKKVLHA
jgi:DNA-binding MarR family transcriptional regulator